MSADRRAARRVATMTRLQQTALRLFEARGFAGVTIEEIAGEAQVGPATVYRLFATKERLVIWDEADEGLIAAMAEQVRRDGARPALLSLAAALDTAPPEAAARHRARLRLIEREPTLRKEAAANAMALGEAIAAGLGARSGREATPEDVALGRALAAALGALVADWARREDAGPLEATLAGALDALAMASAPG